MLVDVYKHFRKKALICSILAISVCKCFHDDQSQAVDLTSRIVELRVDAPFGSHNFIGVNSNTPPPMTLIESVSSDSVFLQHQE